MSWPEPPRSRHSLATAADFAASATAAAPPNRRVLGTTGSAPVKVIVPPVSAALIPNPASTSVSAACGSKASSLAGQASALVSRSVSSIVFLRGQQFFRDWQVFGAQVLAHRFACLIDAGVGRAAGTEQTAKHEVHGSQRR